MLKLMVVVFSLSLPLLISVPAHAQDIPGISSWPDWEEIGQHFFDKYSTHNVESSFTLEFSRNPEGWNVRIVSVFDGGASVDEPIWLKASGKYVDLASLPLLNDSIYNYRLENDMSNVLSNEDYFDYNLFYGYPQWAEDVIKTLEPNLSALSDVSLNQLGRAYAHLATVTLSPGTKEVGKYLAFDSTFRPDSFSAELIEQYVSLSKRAINAYEIIKNRNPGYETFIGKIHTVYSNEHLTAFMHLSLIGQEDIAQQFLVPDLYTPFLLSVGKNQLEACAKDGILITQGDSDTFLFMYVQEKLGVRQDVSIMNKSLMSWGRYINYYKNIVSEAKRIQTTLPMSAYTLENFELLVLEESSGENRLGIETVIKTLAENPDTYPKYEGYNYSLLSSKNFTLSISMKEVPGKLKAMDSPKEPDATNVNIDVEGNVLSRPELFVWDILLTHGLNRPLHFVANMSSRFYLDDYLVNQGMVDTFFPFPSHALEKSKMDLVGVEFDFVQSDEWNMINAEFWILWLKYSYYRAVEQAIYDEDYTRATDLANRMVDYLGNRFASYGYLDYYFAQFYITLEKPELAANLLYAVFDDQSREFDAALESEKPDKKQALEASFETIKMAFDQLISISKNKRRRKKAEVKFERIKNSFKRFSNE